MGRIRDDDILYRRCFPEYIRPNGTVSSATYMLSRARPKKPDPEVSVYLKRITSISETIHLANAPHLEFAVLELTVREVRDLGFEVQPDPGFHARSHCVIKGLITKADCARLATISRVAYHPSQHARP